MKGTEIIMEQQMKKTGNLYRVNTRPIVCLLIGLAFFSLILILTMGEAAKGSSGVKNTGRLNTLLGNNQNGDTGALNGNENQMLAVVTKVDEIEKQISLFDTDSQEILQLPYSGATSVTDKYGQQISMSQATLGTMVDAEYDKASGKLVKLQISPEAWEYIGVNNLSVDNSSNIMKIAGKKYKYTDQIVIFDDDTQVPVNNLAEQDELTVWGYNETIWSIIVTRGHGTVRLEDYEPFIGDNITIGYEAMQQITDDMVIKVREGNFNLTVENGSYSATKNITVYRNKETIVSLSDMGPAAQKTGLVEFEINPFGADLYIDGELRPYASPIKLTYGKHTILVALGGFTTYRGTLNVQEAGKTIKISLPKEGTGGQAVVTEDKDNTGINTGTSGNGSGTATSSNGATNTNSGTSGNTGTSSNGNTSGGDNASDGNTSGGYNPSDGGDTSGNYNPSEGDNDSTGSEDTVDKNHSIIVSAPVGASVYLNGEFKGIAPVKFEKVIGTHVLTFIKEGYETKSYTVEVEDNKLDIYFTMENLEKTR